MKKYINQLPSVSLINRLEKIEFSLSDFIDKFWDDDNCEYTTTISNDISSVIGSIEQVIETYYFLKEHGVK